MLTYTLHISGKIRNALIYIVSLFSNFFNNLIFYHQRGSIKLFFPQLV